MVLAYGDKETVRGTQKDMLEVEVKECNGVKHRENGIVKGSVGVSWRDTDELYVPG